MRVTITGLFLLMAGVQSLSAQTKEPASAGKYSDQEVIELSKAKWRWMAELKCIYGKGING